MRTGKDGQEVAALSVMFPEGPVVLPANGVIDVVIGTVCGVPAAPASAVMPPA